MYLKYVCRCRCAVGKRILRVHRAIMRIILVYLCKLRRRGTTYKRLTLRRSFPPKICNCNNSALKREASFRVQIEHLWALLIGNELFPQRIVIIIDWLNLVRRLDIRREERRIVYYLEDLIRNKVNWKSTRPIVIY